jgi:glycerol-3-phosphate acyltransferase PlsY
MNAVFCLALGYLFGSIPTAYLVGKMTKGIDMRLQGSGNVGATNVFRVVGKKWGIAVLLIDMLKGFIPAFFLPRFCGPVLSSMFIPSLLAGIAAVAGHTWTPWLGFRGGKGVATSLGVLIALAPKAAGIGMCIWIALFFWKRYVSLASLGMALSFPFLVFLFYWKKDFFSILLPISLLLAGFLFFTHRGNIKRLREGAEKKLI